MPHKQNLDSMLLQHTHVIIDITDKTPKVFEKNKFRNVWSLY